jgi:hypothetical protein
MLESKNNFGGHENRLAIFFLGRAIYFSKIIIREMRCDDHLLSFLS